MLHELRQIHHEQPSGKGKCERPWSKAGDLPGRQHGQQKEDGWSYVTPTKRLKNVENYSLSYGFDWLNTHCKFIIWICAILQQVLDSSKIALMTFPSGWIYAERPLVQNGLFTQSRAVWFSFQKQQKTYKWSSESKGVLFSCFTIECTLDSAILDIWSCKFTEINLSYCFEVCNGYSARQNVANMDRGQIDPDWTRSRQSY